MAFEVLHEIDVPCLGYVQVRKDESDSENGPFYAYLDRQIYHKPGSHDRGYNFKGSKSEQEVLGYVAKEARESMLMAREKYNAQRRILTRELNNIRKLFGKVKNVRNPKSRLEAWIGKPLDD